MVLDRKAASRALRRVAELMEVNGENPYKSRAFANAARAVERIEGDLAGLVDSGEILEVRGIGRGIAVPLAEMAAGEAPAVLSDLEQQIPEGVVKMLELRGLGPKKVRSIWQDLDVETLGELEYACRENRLVELPGFGAKSQDRVLEALSFHLRSRDRLLMHDAAAVAERVCDVLAAAPGVQRAVPANEVRRRCETVGVVELLAVGAVREAVAKRVLEVLDQCTQVEDGAWEGLESGGRACRVRFAQSDSAGAALVMATGSSVHLERLAEQGQEVGVRLDWHGVRQADRALPCATEEDVFRAFDCVWVPPEQREGGDELDLAARGRLPDLVAGGQLNGALHNHTTDSDGASSVEGMAQAALRLGWSFLGIADHSPAAVYANGVDIDRLREQWRRIDSWNRSNPELRVLKGLEADILGDGTLDLPAGAADGLDYAVASVHSMFRLSEEAQTDRIVRAVRHPACRVLGHPTGRLLLARPGYEVDLDRVLEACAEHGVAVEINASPYRLDLDWRWAKRAIAMGVALIINPDAHSEEGLEDLQWGLAIARKAGAQRGDVLNTLEVGELVERFRAGV